MLLKIARLLHLINKETYNFLRQVNLIKRSGLFDAEYYLDQNSDLNQSNINPIEH